MIPLDKTKSPQLDKVHAGKVRDSFRLSPSERLVVVTDRISAFDLKLKTPITGKGEVLNRLSAFWFDKTLDIVVNHLVEVLTENAQVVREAAPIRVELVVRGYMAGSMTRAYAQGRREISGVHLPEGLRPNEKLPRPIVTPTTKEESDREITPEGLVREGLVDRDLYARMAETALELFARGTEVLAERGLILCDTKYEMGLVDGRLVLIDEIHTPDSSRIWDAESHARSPKDAEPLDKEYVRAYMLEERERTGHFPLLLPPRVIDETRARYTDLFHRVTGLSLSRAPDPAARLVEALVARGTIRPGFVLVVASRAADAGAARAIASRLEQHGARAFPHIVSPYEPRLHSLCATYTGCIEPGAAIAIGESHEGLFDALHENLDLPVFLASPFDDRSTERAAVSALRALGSSPIRQRLELDAQTARDALSRAFSENS